MQIIDFDINYLIFAQQVLPSASRRLTNTFNVFTITGPKQPADTNVVLYEFGPGTLKPLFNFSNLFSKPLGRSLTPSQPNEETSSALKKTLEKDKTVVLYELGPGTLKPIFNFSNLFSKPLGRSLTPSQPNEVPSSDGN
jgi:hypothetical protein